MTRTGAGILLAIALVAGIGLRLARLDARPMHHDEANQAVKFGALLERGEYRYDALDHHGPTLYYLSLPAAWLRGQPSLAALDEATLRGVAAVFGIATILLLPLLTVAIGRTAVAAAALLMALSPAMVFYSRMYIQEALFACFSLAFVIALGRVATGGRTRWTLVAGLAAGLAVATKETAVIVVPSALAACFVARWSLRRVSPPVALPGRKAVVGSVALAAIVAALFYSSFLANPAGALGPFAGAGTYVERGVSPAAHAHPWYYYLAMLAYSTSGGLTWSEGLILALAAVGIAAACTRPDPARAVHTFHLRYLAGTALLTTTTFSAIPYKTPWNLLPFHVCVIVLAGVGVASVLRVIPMRTLRSVVAVGIVAGMAQLGWQAWRASVTYAADPRNPYVYSQTVPDAVRMATRIRTLARHHPEGSAMVVAVVAPPDEQWPLPWYLRTMPHVGYWTTPEGALAEQAPVLVASTAQTPAVDAALGDRYISEFYGLRPDVLLTLYVERSLWERYLAAEAGAP